jgi:Ca2+/Na+ antiporter
MNKYFIFFKNWLPYAAMITLMCMIIYVITQQNFRLTANDPQTQMAEDAVTAINNGADPKSLIISGPVFEMSKSFSPFIMIYDKAGNIAAGNTTLNGKLLTLPNGVIDYIQKNGHDMVSWQPQPGVRDAMVGIKAAKGYTVIAGRSLHQVEERIATLGEQVLFGWVVSLIGMFIIIVIQEWVTKKYSSVNQY